MIGKQAFLFSFILLLLKDVHNRTHDINHFIVDDYLILFKVFLFFFSELIFFVLIVAKNLNEIEDIFTCNVKQKEDASEDPSKEEGQYFAS